MRKSPLHRSSIARRFIFYIVLFSSFITLIITAFQLYRDYNTDISLIHTELDQIESVHLNSLTAALWASNRKLLQTSIEGILKIRDMQYVEIRDEQKLWAKAGEIRGSNNIQRNYPMKYRHRNKDLSIGTLMVNVSLDGVYQRLYDKVWVILVVNAVKTSLVALFIYFLFYKLVARHLSTISEFSEQHDPLSNNTSLTLDRNNKSQDEFDAVVKSINDMHKRLHEQISEIEHQKQYLSQTLNSIGDAVITTDDKGFVTRLNPVAEQLTGWTNKQAYMQSLKSVFKIVNATSRKPITNPVEKVLAYGETVYLSNHTTLIAKNGHEYHIADSAAPIRDGKQILGMVLVFNDVTEQYQLREKLQEKEQEQREILQSMVDAVITIDEEGIVNTFNHSAERLFGYSVSEISGKNINCLMPEPYSSSHDQYLKNYLDSGITKVIGQGREVTGLRKDKTIFPMRIFVEELPSAIDGKRRFISSCTDLTKLKEHEEQLRRSQKMEALGKLTGGIAHDYNNMLGVVLGYAELLQSMLNSNPVLLDYVNEIYHAAERGAKLTKKLLSFSRQESTDAEAIELNKVLLDEQHMLEKTLTARIKLVLVLEDELDLICADAGDLEDAILNISINAMHAIENNGRLIIETMNKKIDSFDANLLDLQAGDYVLLKITDTGCGMDEVTRERIFDPFYSTKGDKGTGLGLSQVYGFITRCDGSIQVESQPGQGSQFTLYFPKFIGEDNNKNQSVTESLNNLKGKETLLIVDDETALLHLTCESLNRHGYSVFCAENARDALEILNKESVDVLISDIIMPDMNGYELASIVKKKYPKIKIQLVSGFSDEQNIGNTDSGLSKSLLQKPYSTRALLNKIRELLE